MSEEMEIKPVLSVEVINAAYEALKKALLAECEARKAQYQYQGDRDFQKDDPWFNIQILDLQTTFDRKIAKAEVDRVNAIQLFFQTASLNQLSAIEAEVDNG